MSSETKVRLTGWKSGLRTIDLTMLIRNAARVDLRRAKRAVDELLDGGEVTLCFETEDLARAFWARAELTGVICQIVS